MSPLTQDRLHLSQESQRTQRASRICPIALDKQHLLGKKKKKLPQLPFAIIHQGPAAWKSPKPCLSYFASSRARSAKQEDHTVKEALPRT